MRVEHGSKSAAPALSGQHLSWDGFKNITITGNELSGFAWRPGENDWVPFRVDLRTGDAEGGSYPAAHFPQGMVETAARNISAPRRESPAGSKGGVSGDRFPSGNF